MSYYRSLILLFLSVLFVGCTADMNTNFNYPIVFMEDSFEDGQLVLTFTSIAGHGTPVIEGIPVEQVTVTTDSMVIRVSKGQIAKVNFPGRASLGPFPYKEIFTGSESQQFALMPLP